MIKIIIAACLIFLSAETAWGLHSYRNMELKRPAPKPASDEDAGDDSELYHPYGEKDEYGPLPTNALDRPQEPKDPYDPYDPVPPEADGKKEAARQYVY